MILSGARITESAYLSSIIIVIILIIDILTIVDGEINHLLQKRQKFR